MFVSRIYSRCPLILGFCTALTWAPLSGIAQGDAREVLKKGDVISLNVFGEDSLTKSILISAEGKAVIPLLGALDAAGKSTTEFAALIEAGLEQDFIRDAQVSVSILEKRKKQVNVLGSVRAAGSYEFEDTTKLNLRTSIEAAGGLDENANKEKIEVVRLVAGTTKTYMLDLDGSASFSIKDEDTIVVYGFGKMGFVAISGEVASPGVLEIPPNMKFDLLTAITTAGGFTDIADKSDVEVKREINGRTQTFTFNVRRESGSEFIVQDGDKIIVGERMF